MNKKGQILNLDMRQDWNKEHYKSITENMNTVVWTCLRHMDHMCVEHLVKAKKMYTQDLRGKTYFD